MNDELDEKPNEELNEEPDGEIDFEDVPKSEENVEFEYDVAGNIIIPDDTEDTESENTPAAEEKTHDNEEKNVESSSNDIIDQKDIEIANLRKQITERDEQIRDTLKSLGADENEGVAGLERIAAEAADIPVEEYRRKKTERMRQEEAVRLLQKQKFDEKIQADLISVQRAYPETRQYKSVFEFPNFEKFSNYRDLGLPPDEAYIAANSKEVMANVVGAVQRHEQNLSRTKEHLHSNVPAGAKDRSVSITKEEMSEYRDIFPNLSDKEIIALHKQTLKK